MKRPDTIEDLVDHFVAGILALIEQLRREHRAAALAIVVGSMLEQRSVATTPAHPSPGEKRGARSAKPPAAARPRSRRGPAAEPQRPVDTRANGAPKPVDARPPVHDGGDPSTPATGVAPEPRAEKRRARAGAASQKGAPGAGRRPPSQPPPTQASPIATAVPVAEAADPASQRPREALVLEAVRSLGRGTAGEIARHGGLPNGTALVVLRSLLARGQVARADTARGVEYRAT